MSKHNQINTFLNCASPMTIEGVNDPSRLSSDGSKRHYHNRKPFRTAAQKAEARKTAWQDARGIWHSNAPLSFHRA